MGGITNSFTSLNPEKSTISNCGWFPTARAKVICEGENSLKEMELSGTFRLRKMDDFLIRVERGPLSRINRKGNEYHFHLVLKWLRKQVDWCGHRLEEEGLHLIANSIPFCSTTHRRYKIQSSSRSFLIGEDLVLILENQTCWTKWVSHDSIVQCDSWVWIEARNLCLRQYERVLQRLLFALQTYYPLTTTKSVTRGKARSPITISSKHG